MAKREKNNMKLLIGLLGLMIFSASAKMPGFDIYIGDLLSQDGLLEISHIKPVTQRPEYDNQPYFLPDGRSLLYTSARMKDGIEQTDSMFVSLVTGESVNLTDSPASEYSPTLMPNGRDFSVIWASDDKQKLWRYPLHPNDKKSSLPSELLSKVNPVGYQAWIDSDNVLLFVLGEPHTLQRANIRKQTIGVLDDNIGPSLYAIPGTKLMSFTSSVGVEDNLVWDLKSYNPDTNAIDVLTTLPKGAYYYGWSADGKVIAAIGAQIQQWDMKSAQSLWLTIADLSEICPKGLSRMTTNAQNTKIALVCIL